MKSKLDQYGDRIREQLRDGATISAIWENLKKDQISVSYETLRSWVTVNEGRGDVDSPKRKRGRIPKSERDLFKFLPAQASISSPMPLPIFLLPLLKVFASNEETRAEATKQVFEAWGIPVDLNVPRQSWIIPSRLLAKLSDLERCFAAYLVSDLPSPPLDRNVQDFGIWMEKLANLACRMQKGRLQKPDGAE